MPAKQGQSCSQTREDSPCFAPATGVFDLTVTLPGEGRQRFEGLACGNPAFRRLDWCGFVSNADAPVVLYLDDVSLKAR